MESATRRWSLDLLELTDAELLRLTADLPWDGGGSDAFWTVWSRHMDWIETRIRVRECSLPQGLNGHLFSDRVKDRVLENFIRGAKLYRDSGNVRGFLSTIINHAAIDEYRWQIRRPRQVDIQTGLGRVSNKQHSEEETLSLLAYWAGKSSRTPDETIETRELAELRGTIYKQIIEESKDGYKWAKALNEFYVGEWTVSEIAEEIGVSERTVARWLEKGREAALRILRERFNTDELESL